MTLNEYFDELVKIQIAEEIFINEINSGTSLQDKMLEEIEFNLRPEKSEIKSETNIDWNFVLGLFFGIGYLILKAHLKV